MKNRSLFMPLAAALLILAAAAGAATVAQTTTVLDGKNARAGESTLGDLVADAVRLSGKAEIALVSSGLLNEVAIPVGPVTDQALTSSLAFPDDTIVVLLLKGSQIRQAMERSLDLYPTSNSAFLQVSGMTMDVNPAAPTGQRVISIQVNGTEIDPARSYQVAMPISLGRGSLGYFRIWSKDDLYKTTPIKMGAAVTDQARRQGKLTYKPGQRIVPKTGQ